MMIQTSDIRDALLDERGGRGEFQVRAGNGAKKKNPEPGEREIEQSSAALYGRHARGLRRRNKKENNRE